MTPDERLLSAAKRVKRLLDAQLAGTYYGPSEDIQAGRELAAAIQAVEEQRVQERLMVQR